MADENFSSSESNSSAIKQRKRSKWDQPDESLLSAGVAVPRVFPLGNMGCLGSVTLPYVPLVSGAPVASSFSSATLLQAVQVPLQQHAAAILQKLIQPKIQDELVAREIVINDADPAIRYKLTRRQTQEEIQRCTGALVITRGKYRPPNVPSDGEKPLYLHISAASHLDTTGERIKAVDQAAAMVEEMLNHASLRNGVNVDHSLSAHVFLGFEADPSLNIALRIRGPNDQYVNHIMKETGATVVLRGHGSGRSGSEQSEEAHQPLHLLLSSSNIKSLEHAKLLAENLLATFSTECGSSRVSSTNAYVSSRNAYGAVPPPTMLNIGVQSPIHVHEISASAAVNTSSSQGLISQSMAMSNTNCYPQASSNIGTSYIGYGGIYPQATPLQQVALALRQSTSPVTATVSSSTVAARIEPPLEAPPSVKDKRRPEKRKFKESTGRTNLNQGSEFQVPHELISHVGSSVQSQNKFTQSLPNVMSPPTPRNISSVAYGPKYPSSKVSIPPPRSKVTLSPPPKFDATPKPQGDNHSQIRPNPQVVPDTLVKLMEYGDDDDDDEESTEIQDKNHSILPDVNKPFWAA